MSESLAAPHEATPFTFSPAKLHDGAVDDPAPGGTLEQFAERYQNVPSFAPAALTVKGDDGPAKYEKPKALGGFVIGTFKGGRRSRDAYVSGDAIGIEYDGTWTLAEARETFAREDLRVLVYTTFNHRHDGRNDRFRLIVPTSRALMSADEYDAAWAHLNTLSGGRADGRAKDPSRFWYLPGVVQGRPYTCEIWPGAPLDVSSLPTRPEATQTAARTAPEGADRAAVVFALASGLRRDCPGLGKRHESAGAIAGALVRDSILLDDEIPGATRDACELAGFEKLDVKEASARDTVKKHRNGERVTGWPKLMAEFPAVYSALKAATGNVFAGLADAEIPESAAPVSAREFGAELDADSPLPPIDWLVGGLIQRGSVDMFVAHGGSLKTWVALSMMLAVQSGKPWLGGAFYEGYKVEQTNVLFLDYESMAHEVQRRIQILHRSTPRPRIRYEPHPGSLHDRKTWERVEACICEHGIGLVVIDSLSGGSGTEDENTPAFAAPLKVATAVSDRTGCAFLFIHHANKNGEGHKAIRGSTAIHAACDAVYGFSEVSDSADIKSTEMYVIKPGPGPTPRPVKVALSDADGLYKEATEWVGASGDERMRNEILAHLDRGPSTQTEVENAVKGTAKTKRQILTDLVKDGEAVIIDRRYRRDGSAQRWGRVRTSLADAVGCEQKPADLMRLAHVSKPDLDTLEREGKIWKSGTGVYSLTTK